jgi:hypothetical protein
VSSLSVRSSSFSVRDVLSVRGMYQKIATGRRKHRFYTQNRKKQPTSGTPKCCCLMRNSNLQLFSLRCTTYIRLRLNGMYVHTQSCCNRTAQTESTGEAAQRDLCGTELLRARDTIDNEQLRPKAMGSNLSCEDQRIRKIYLLKNKFFNNVDVVVELFRNYKILEIKLTF